MYEQKDRLQIKWLSGEKKVAFDWWDQQLLGRKVKKNNKMKQKQQTLTTSKIYVKQG